MPKSTKITKKEIDAYMKRVEDNTETNNKIDLVGIWNRELTNGEITKLYNNNI